MTKRKARRRSRRAFPLPGAEACGKMEVVFQAGHYERMGFMAKRFDGDAVYASIQKLPQGGAQMAALKDAIQQADAAEDHYWRMLLRYSYACQATFHDDPPKAMPAAAEFEAVFEAHPDVLFERSAGGAAEMYLMITQMGLDPIVSLPQIPMAQWEEQMQRFRALVQEYHIGLRTYWWQMCRFWQYIDKEQAFIYFRKFWRTGRDGLSDCRACERSYGVRMCLMIGDRAAADEYAKPMEAGRIWFCKDTPHLYWLAYLEDALDHKERGRAKAYADKLYRKSNRDRGDLSYLGAIIRCWAQADELERAVELAAKRLEWSLWMWDKKKQYDYYKGAWVCFRELAKGTDSVTLALPEPFPLFREEGVYAPRELAGWFYQQAAEIGAAFDRRNGSDFFKKDLALA